MTKPISTYFSSLLLMACALFIASCANQDQRTELAPSAPATKAAPQKVADRYLPTETLYAILVAEMAFDRQRYDIALGNYVQQATATRDPGVAARATHLARMLKARQSALEMSELWLSLEPDNADAKLIATAELVEANRLAEALENSKSQLQLNQRTVLDAIAIKATEGEGKLVPSFLTEYQQLSMQHPKNVKVHIGLSVLLMHQNQLKEALKASQVAIRHDPKSIRAAFQETRVLQKMGKHKEIVDRMEKLVNAHPANRGLRARFARLLASHDLKESLKQFRILHQQAPYDADILYSLAIIEKQSGNISNAENYFAKLISREQHVSAAHYQLGLIYKEQSRTDDALKHLREVKPGQNYLDAMAKAIKLLVDDKNEVAALELVRQEKEEVTENFREGLFMLESDILSTAGQKRAAEVILTNGLKEFPQSSTLLYARAMIYTQIDYISAAEKDLKQIIGMFPENSAALNALGYTLADRTDRFEEAYEYIKRALALAPEDPAVLDSMGWVKYRLGKYEEALARLRQAMNAMPDHEIAAHLGEVLWVTGVHQEARSVWKQGLELNPQSEIIHNTIHRLNVDLSSHD